MILPLPVCVLHAQGDLRRSLVSRSKFVHWAQAALLITGLSGAGWAQCFQTALDPTYGNGNHYFAVVGDFNGDGQSDLATTNGGTNKVSVLLGNGQGGFGVATDFAVGTDPGAAAVGDFNGDSRPDLAVANAGGDNISLLLNNGQGSFGTAINFKVGDHPGPIKVGDFNKDSKPDLIVVNTGYESNNDSDSSNVSVLLNNGQGGFLKPTNFTVSRNPRSIEIGDFNGDNQPDLAVVSYGADNVSVLLGNGQGGFGPASYFRAGYSAYSIAVGDFNGDTQLDLATLIHQAIAILPGDGKGGFGAASYIKMESASSITVGYFNGDRRPDLALIDGGGISVLLSNGQGGYGQATKYVQNNDQTSSVVVGDFNGDSQPDLAVTNGGTISTLLNNGQGVFNGFMEVRLNDNANSVAAGDFNNDSWPDLAVTNGSNVSVLLNNGQGGFRQATNFAVNSKTSSIAVGDFNKDNRLDLAVGNAGVSVLLGNGQGEFGTPINLTVANSPFSIGVGDFNGDSWLDLVTSNTGPDNVSVLLNNGQGSFGQATNFPAGEDPSNFAVGDFNNDGLPDLIVGNNIIADSPNGFITMLLNNGRGGFKEPSFFYAGGRNPDFVAVGDFNGDDLSDVAVSTGGYRSYNTSVLLGNGQGGFSKISSFLTGQDSGPVVVADFNGDDKLDMAVTTNYGFSESNVAVFLGDGQGEFARATYFRIRSSAQDMAVNDFNKDGRPDLAVIYYESRNISVLYNCPNVNQSFLTSLDLINADNGEVIGSLTEGQELNLATLPTRNFSIRANAGASTGSVTFNLTGPQSHTNTESVLPFALFGDNSPTSYIGWTPPIGQYNLTVTPYGKPLAGGLAGPALSINFTVVDPNQPYLDGVSLINADNGQLIGRLVDGQEVNLATLPTRNISIRADAIPAAGSVTFALMGPQNHTKTESNLPFALFGDYGFSQYLSWTPPLGDYNLTVTPYPQPSAGGTAGPAVSLSFTVIDQPQTQPALRSLSLVNADNGQVIGPLTDGQVLNLSALPTRNLSVLANVNAVTGSVTFALTGPQNHAKTESVLPFALFGDTDYRNYIGWTPPTGQYTLTLTPYAQPGAGGAIGQALSISFRVEDQVAARVTASEEGVEDESALSVRVLGNPTPAESVEVDIQGAAGRWLEVVVSDEQGRQLSQQRIDKAQAIERRRVGLGRAAGVYMLRIATPTQSQTVRVLHTK